MSNDPQGKDPLEFMKGLWGNGGFALPGMVTPTFDTDELEKRIHDLKAVEGWLRMNLSMLQMTIQNLEMQRTTLSAVRAMSQMVQEGEGPAAAAGDAAGGAFAQAAMWPWQMMQQMQAQMQQAQAAPAAAQPEPPAGEEPPPAPKKGARKS